MTRSLSPSVTDLAPLLSAKGRVPLLPRLHIPRPRPVGLLAALARTHRLVLLSAGVFAGKTTLLAEFAASGEAGRVFWYSVDEVDETPRVVLEGLVYAVGAPDDPGDDTHLLARIVGVLGATTGPTVLIMDDIHRSSACAPVVERLLRYLPSDTCLVLSGHPRETALPSLYRWLEDQGQVAHVPSAALRLDEEERARFRVGTGQDGGTWAVDYRRGGQEVVVDGLRQGVLPALAPDLRALIDPLCVLPVATAVELGAATHQPEGDVTRCLAALRDETIMLEQIDATHYRLTETARRAGLTGLDERTRAAYCVAMATALECNARDVAQAAHLYAQGGDIPRALMAARRVPWWEWQRRQSLALAVAALLPSATLRQASALALTIARLRLVERGARAVHASVRVLQPDAPIDRYERLRLLTHCAAARGRPWSVGRCLTQLERLVAATEPSLTDLDRAYGLVTLGIAQSLADRYQEAAATLHDALGLLGLAGGNDAWVAHTRLLAQRALAVIHRRLGNLDEAERLYTTAHAELVRDAMPAAAAELANNHAVLLQQRGEHARSADMIRETLASPWSAEPGLRAVLNASLADALDALGDRAGAAHAVHTALIAVEDGDVFGLRGHLHARRALLLAEGGQRAAAQAAIAAGAPPRQAATLLARALMHDPLSAEARPALEEALTAVGPDIALRAQVRAHLARVCALHGDRARARVYADAVVGDHAYPLTPREAAILGPHTRRIRQPRQESPHVVTPAPITIRFFGPPVLYVDGHPLGSAWWARSKGRALLWYALARGAMGFTREEACADLYPDMDAEAGGRALRNTLYELRKLLRERCGVAALRSVGARLRLLPEDLGTPWETDTHTVQKRLARLRGGDTDAGDDLPALIAGHYVADLHDDWVLPHRRYWEREAMHALDLSAAAHERAGRPTEALACLQREVEFNPDDTALLRRVMRLYHALGDVGGLRATYAAHCRTMREELDLAPDPRIVTLYEQLTRL